MKPIFQFVETLEARVAPAILVNGGNLLGGAGNPTTGETSSGTNTITLVKVISGQALVFWDANHSEITGISVGKHTVLDITGNIYGDIVTNLGKDGRLTDSDNNPANGEDGGILLNTGIKGITTHALNADEPGNIGRIIAGGAVKNVNMAANSSLSGIYAGDGIFRNGSSVQVKTGDVDFNTINPGLDNVFGGAAGIQQANAQVASGATIKNVQVYSANQLQVFAGSGAANSGGAGGAGGNITNLTIVRTLDGSGDTPAAFLHAGDGGAGTSGGGAGGNITNFNDQGSIAYVKLQTGTGGAASGGTGGDGGALTASTVVTSSPRYDLIMGAGGDGVAGGKGGGISQLNFTNNVTGGQSIIATGDFNADGHRDVLLVNTLNGNATLSLGTGGTGTDTEAAFNVAYQTTQTPGGTVSTPFIAPLGSVPTDVVAADVNGDGHLDFVVSYAGSDNLGVFLGNGAGTFTGHSVALSLSPTHLAAGNFTGTAAVDLAVLSGGNTPSANGGLTSAVAVLKNDGAGAFTQSAALTLTGTATAFAPAQINAAGGTDLFVGFTNGTVDTLFANGTTFTAGPVLTAFTSTTTTNVPVDALDAAQTGSTTLLLAFSTNIDAGVTTTNPDGTTSAATAVPEVKLITIGTNGAQGFTQVINPAAAATTAHFVTNSTAVGIISPSALDIYQNQDGVYTLTASLGSNGALNNFSAYNNDGTFQIAAVGASTSRFFYTEGTPGAQSGIPAFKPFDIPFTPGVIQFVAGDGGAGTTLNGGAGGAISALTFKQQLGSGVLEAGGSYNVIVTTGDGGDGGGGAGGRGGDLSTTDLTLNPANQTVQDDTSAAILTTGHGGNGTVGGKGGDLSGLTSTSVFSQQTGTQLFPGAVAVQITAGNGGVGTAGAGGAGGNVTLAGKTSISGVTFYDADSTTPFAPALSVRAGNGGAGTSAGGAGGGLFNIGTQNATGSVNVAFNELSSAALFAGNGGAASAGNGGDGGTVNGMDVAVQRARLLNLLSRTGLDGYGGSLEVTAGHGGNGTDGLGGKGGSINKSTAASVDGDDTTRFFGVLAAAGAGGDGDLGGGQGGKIKSLTINSPSADDVYAAVLAAGNGGAALTSGAGGDGGKIKGVTQTKDVNSSINVIQAGNGGASASGEGGSGGSVKAINTVGFIGLPATASAHLGVFDPGVNSPTAAALFAGGVVPQGIFAGQGADGASAGSVLNVVARQIAAIAASENVNRTFGVAATVANIKADLIGYDVNGDGAFNSANGGSPSGSVPVDGFILASTVTGITTLDNNRTAAFTFNS